MYDFNFPCAYLWFDFKHRCVWIYTKNPNAVEGVTDLNIYIEQTLGDRVILHVLFYFYGD